MFDRVNKQTFVGNKERERWYEQMVDKQVVVERVVVKRVVDKQIVDRHIVGAAVEC